MKTLIRLAAVVLFFGFSATVLTTRAQDPSPAKAPATPAPAATTAAPAKTSDDAGAIADLLFAAMREKNGEKIRALFLPEGRLITIQKPRTGAGPSKMRVLSGDEFAQVIAAGQGDYIERMTTKTVEVQGELALVSGRYTFHVGDKFSHCGSNAFQLIRTEAGWKIANGASTLEFECGGESAPSK